MRATSGAKFTFEQVIAASNQSIVLSSGCVFLFHSDLRGVGEFSLDVQSNVNFTAPCKVARQPDVDLVQPSKLSLRAGIQNFSVYAADGCRHGGERVSIAQ